MWSLYVMSLNPNTEYIQKTTNAIYIQRKHPATFGHYTKYSYAWL